MSRGRALGSVFVNHQHFWFDTCSLQIKATIIVFIKATPEDFIGRMSCVASAGNNSNLEYVTLKRFYLG